MLLSVVNLKLRDFTKTSMLCAKTWMPTRATFAQSSGPWATSTMPSATSSCDDFTRKLSFDRQRPAPVCSDCARAGEYRNKECLIYDPGYLLQRVEQVLNREMEFKVYGNAGVPVLALPARGGRFYDWENNGMPDAIAPLLNEGKMQLFCADSIDGEAVLNGDIPVRRRAEMEEKYFVYLTAELAPRVLALNGAAKGPGCGVWASIWALCTP